MLKMWLYKGPDQSSDWQGWLQTSGHLPDGQRKADKVVSEERAMLGLKTLPFLFLLHMQLAKALPVPPEVLEETNAKIVEVNELSF